MRDNLRDRRALFFSLIYGPLLIPCIILGPFVMMAGDKVAKQSAIQTIHIADPDRAPNLLAFLKANNIAIEKASSDYRDKLVGGTYSLVLEVSDNYAENLLNAKPAEIFIYYLKDNERSREKYHYVSNALLRYANAIVGQRMWIRGIETQLLSPLAIEPIDLSAREPFLSTVAHLLQFLVLLSMVMGGFYLAVDVVAGEREHESLEPLLSLPVSVIQLVLGKYLAVLFFCSLCGICALLNAFVWLSYLPEALYFSADSPTYTTLLKCLLFFLPLAVLIASVLLMVSTFAKTIKEAQTQLSAVMMLVMAPFIALQFFNTGVQGPLSILPVAGHYLFVELLLFDASFSFQPIRNLAFTCMVFTAIFVFLTIRIFRSDGFLKG